MRRMNILYVRTGGKETTVRDKCVQYIVASLIKGFSGTIQDTVCKQWSNVSWPRSPQDEVQMSELSIFTPYFMYIVVYNTLKYITRSPCVLQQVTVNGSQKEAHIKGQRYFIALP